ncbi:hypothetical protein RWE15_16280 [Virgibacillus halophilus]|uniref:Cysteinyl-tRNA ligase anticodon binding domain-containing protein n=1 Tax=Tigheibacillus halophilus TaxID=361280 RepID=A0ABU5C8L8_9BACI|nr:hypothetical protein [Virgibacillus halophilus]
METKVDKAHEAFHRYQYPWCEKDPFEGQYQRWVLGHPDFPENVNTLLHARERALKEDEEKDAKHLREDLAKLGAIIKDEKKSAICQDGTWHQSWKLIIVMQYFHEFAACGYGYLHTR